MKVLDYLKVGLIPPRFAFTVGVRVAPMIDKTKIIPTEILLQGKIFQSLLRRNSFFY